MRIILQDLRYGARMLLKNPGFTLIAVITLALGIGANTAIFSIINGVLLRPLPYKDPQRLVMVEGTKQLSSLDFIALRHQNQVFEQAAAFISQELNLTGHGEPEFLGDVVASANLFSLLGVEALYGRVFLPEEEQPGNHRVVILSYGFWQRRFGSDPKIVGQKISLNDQLYTIVGVMPPGFQFPRKGDMPGVWPIPSVVDIYTPTAFAPEQWNNRKSVSVIIIARLKPQFSLEQAQAEMNGIAERRRQESTEVNWDQEIRVETLHQHLVGRVKLALLVFLGAVGFLLLIACANVANLTLMRATARRKEIVIRAALGAGRGRVFKQLLTESVLLAMASGSLALLLAFWGVDLLRLIIPGDMPRADQIGIDGKVLGFTLLISAFTGILFGLVPALQAARLSLSEVLKEGGRSSGGIGHHYFRNLLVVSEVALALMLLSGAGLMLRSFMRLTSVEPGLDTHHLLTTDIRLPRNRYSPLQQVAFYRQLLERLRVMPGVQAATAAYPLPLSGAEEGIGFNIEGEPPPGPGQWRYFAKPRCIGTDYFKTLEIRLQRGRVFQESDGVASPPVVIINEVLARQYWPDQDAIGKRMVLNISPEWREVIGVVKSVRQLGLSDELRPELYFPFAQFPAASLTLVVRTNGEPLNFVTAVRDQVQAIDKDQPISNIHTMDELLGKTLSQPRFNLILLAIFAGVALLLAAVGIYGVMSYMVMQRTQEIGIRMALGAQTRDVLKLVIGQGMRLALLGVSIGLAGALALTHLLKALLFGVSTTDPLTFVVIGLVLAIVTLLACWIPARQATKVDPIIALRFE
jgi:putative ABC transport system permease protein